MQQRQLCNRQGDRISAHFDLVAPLVTAVNAVTTEMRVEDSDDNLCRDGSGAVAAWIGDSLLCPDVDSANQHSTLPTATMPGIRTSTTATRTTGTRTTRVESVRSADQSAYLPHADLSFTETALAYFDCREHKRNSNSALMFERDLERNLAELHHELISGTYTPGTSICFVITRPKTREVWAADFRDRIVHHILYNRIGPRFINSFIADSCACIEGRGTLYAAKRLDAKVRSITQNWSRDAYYLKCDVANFFVAINKPILFELLAKNIHEPWWLQLAATVLFHDPRQCITVQSSADRLALVPAHKSLFNQTGNNGLPIGNLSSQFFANVYLNELDQFVKHQIGARHYIRYVDDFVLLHDSPQWLNAAKARIEVFMRERLALYLNPTKTILQPIYRGIDFVGQVIKPWRRITRRRTAHDAIRRVRTIASDRLYEVANSYFGLFRQSSRSHEDRVRLAKTILRRGHAVDNNFTKTFRKSMEQS
jgi:RNA-directed DNA polymerase